MKIAIASDHRGYKLKQELITYLKNKNYEIEDLGTNSEKSVDYPKYAFKLCHKVINENLDFGIAICGTGIGISIACNKVKDIMCAKISTVEEAILAKQHNHANILALSGATNIMTAQKMLDEYINAKEFTEEKYIRRINQIKDYEIDEH